MSAYRWLDAAHTHVLRVADGANIPAERLHDFPEIVLADVAPFRRYDTVNAAQDGRLAELSQRRKRAEEAFVFNGTPIRLDDGTQQRINAAISYLALSGATSVRWQIARGTFATFNAATLDAIGVAAGAHIQACFANVEALAGAILAAETIEDIDAIDLDAGWP